MAYVPLPPPVPDQDDAPAISGSFMAPADIPLVEQELRSVRAPRGSRILALLQYTFVKRRYGPARYRLRIDEPKQLSAEDEHPARHSLTLVTRNDSAPEIPCGWVDLSKKHAQVRSFAVVAQRHREEYGCAPELGERDYKRFLGTLIETLFDSGVRLVLLAPEPRTFPLARFVDWLRKGSVLSPLGTTLLLVVAFALGLNAEHLGPWIDQLPSWLERASAWGEQGLTWLRQAPAWIALARGHYSG
jgi:hypothetical protein